MFGHLNHGKVELDGAVTITTGEGAEIVEYTAKATIAAGQVVQMRTGATGSSRATEVIVGTATNLAIGVALEAVVSGDTVRVCIGGYIENVVCLAGGAAPALGEHLMPIAGGAVDTVAGAFDSVAIAMEAGVASTVDIYWFRRA